MIKYLTQVEKSPIYFSVFLNANTYSGAMFFFLPRIILIRPLETRDLSAAVRPSPPSLAATAYPAHAAN
jgi:hypothetical protein